MILNYGWFMSGIGNDEEPSGRHVLGYTSLEPLSKNLPAEIKNSEYSKCPAFTKDMKKIFVVKAGFEFEVDIDQIAESWDGSDQGYINRHLSLVNLANDRLIQYTTDLVVFCDKPLNLSIMHPFLHHNSWTDTGHAISGTFDVGNWFRPIQAALFVRPNMPKINLNIKQGDILFYLKADTDENIKLSHFSETRRLRELMLSCLQLKHTRRKIFTLQEAYARFTQHNFRKQILAEIKRQNNE